MAPPRKSIQPPDGAIFESLLHQAGFTREDVANALCIDTRTVVRYIIDGHVPEPLLRLLKVFAWSDIEHDDLLALFPDGAKTRRTKK